MELGVQPRERGNVAASPHGSDQRLQDVQLSGSRSLSRQSSRTSGNDHLILTQIADVVERQRRETTARLLWRRRKDIPDNHTSSTTPALGLEQSSSAQVGQRFSKGRRRNAETVRQIRLAWQLIADRDQSQRYDITKPLYGRLNEALPNDGRVHDVPCAIEKLGLNDPQTGVTN